MAARLTVIISQAASRNSAATELEESLVAELLFQAGLDANLVGPLETIAPESTDHLCISGFNHNLALLSWLDADEVQTHFDRLGLDGTVRLLGGDASIDLPAQSGSASGRAIFLLQLRNGSRVPQLLEQLQRLLQARRTPTFSILPAAPPRKSSPAEPATSPSPNKDTSARTPSAPPTPAVPAGRTANPLQPRDDEELTDEQWSQLDQLVDDFDALDF